jgi:hypothetical protein
MNYHEKSFSGKFAARIENEAAIKRSLRGLQEP